METTQPIYEVTGTQTEWSNNQSSREIVVRFVDRNIKSVWLARSFANDAITATIWTIDPVTGKRSRFETQAQAKIAHAEHVKKIQEEYCNKNKAV